MKKLIILVTFLATNVVAQPVIIDAQTGKYLGNLNQNVYDPNSVNNPYGQYGNKYSPDSVNNPYGQYGNKYSPDSVNNPYAPGRNHGKN